MAMTDDEIAAYHEAAHAAVAYCSEWTQLADDLVLLGRGHGDAAVKLNRSALLDAIAADQDFDSDVAREQLIYAFLAGAAAERELVARRLTTISEAEILKAASRDYQLAREQLGKLEQAAPLVEYEQAVTDTIRNPVPWCVISKLAEELIERRTIPLTEVQEVIDRIGNQCAAEHAVPGIEDYD